jgi:hypothetical protein
MTLLHGTKMSSEDNINNGSQRKLINRLSSFVQILALFSFLTQNKLALQLPLQVRQIEVPKCSSKNYHKC